jgi:hypothetical protein
MIQINSGCQFFSSTTEKKAGKQFIVAIISAFIFADGFCVSLWLFMCERVCGSVFQRR